MFPVVMEAAQETPEALLSPCVRKPDFASLPRQTSSPPAAGAIACGTPPAPRWEEAVSHATATPPFQGEGRSGRRRNEPDASVAREGVALVVEDVQHLGRCGQGDIAAALELHVAFELGDDRLGIAAVDVEQGELAEMLE